MENIMQQNKFNWGLINDNISESDKQCLVEFISQPNVRFTNGAKVKEFEKCWSDWLGVKHTTFVNSGASANYIMMSIVKEMRGVGEVIVPPIGWVSDIAPAVNLGFTPVFVDVDMSNFSISLDSIKKATTEKTKAIVLVHALGFNGVTEDLVEFAKERNILLIEDCCESHGATYKGQKIGTFGDMSNFSFYFGHHITTIEGGVVCTNNEEIYQYTKLFRSHGMTREASDELQKKYIEKYPDLNPLFTFAVPGYNMRGTELNAVLGLKQMKRIDFNIEKRVQNFGYWLDNLDNEKYYTDYDVEGNSNFALPLLLNSPDKTLLKKVCSVLEEEKVEYRLGTAGGGNQARQPYLVDGDYDFVIAEELNNTNHIHDYGLYIGNHTDLTKEQIVNLCKRINNV
jgi:CDP-4-dehydro-6-deoxyglucose reductase, E1